MIGTHHVYRASTKLAGYLTAVLLGLGAVLLLRMYFGDVSTEALVWVSVGWLLFTAALMALVVRSATVLRGTGIEARAAFGSRSYSWAEIADIKIEEVAGPASKIEIFSAVIYDADLRRVALPYLNDKRLGDQLKNEVAELRRRWEFGRGPDWRPRTAEVEQRIDSRQSRDRVWKHAIITLCVAFAVTAVVVFGVLIAAAGTPFVQTPLFSGLPWLMGIVPVVAFVLVAVIGLLRRRANSR